MATYVRTAEQCGAADRQELRALRKLAREHNLPMPEEDS